MVPSLNIFVAGVGWPVPPFVNEFGFAGGVLAGDLKNELIK